MKRIFCVYLCTFFLVVWKHYFLQQVINLGRNLIRLSMRDECYCCLRTAALYAGYYNAYRAEQSRVVLLSTQVCCTCKSDHAFSFPIFISKREFLYKL